MRDDERVYCNDSLMYKLKKEIKVWGGKTLVDPKIEIFSFPMYN